jgi:putative hydrolase of the HAD superfamily
LKKYKHLLFDLDHTLWDYNQNVRVSLGEVFYHYKIDEGGNVRFEDFFDAFIKTNEQLWHQFNTGLLDREGLREVRFPKIFKLLQLNELTLPTTLEDDFIQRTSSKSGVIPFAFETLNYLKGNYDLHVITNGFNESQYSKLKFSQLDTYFDLVVTSENSGYRKPDKRIFQHALERLSARASECLMIGDNPHSDILGAQNAKIDQVFFNPGQVKSKVKATHTIHCLSELQTLL